MDMNSINANNVNLYQQSQGSGEISQKPEGFVDKVEIKKLPGSITCYMYSKMKERKGTDEKELFRLRTEAINNALNEGAITPETAKKLME